MPNIDLQFLNYFWITGIDFLLHVFPKQKGLNYMILVIN